jgi:hypothetical protein
LVLHKIRLFFINLYFCTSYDSESLISAEEFASRYSSSGGVINVSIQIPQAADTATGGAWNLMGQVVKVCVNVTDSIKQLKEEAANKFLNGMPLNKQQIRVQAAPSLGFLKDSCSLAELNVGDGALLELSVKSRGGKR